MSRKAKGNEYPACPPSRLRLVSGQRLRPLGRKGEALVERKIGMQNMPENIEKVQLPAADCDTLSGYEQIGAWQGITGAQARWRAAEGVIPVHRLKGRNLVIAFKSEIVAHMRALVRKSRKISEEQMSDA
jgi:hypothetical protein